MKSIIFGSATLWLGLLCSAATAQEELPFLGTWTLDTTEIEKQMKSAGMDTALVKQRIVRLQQMQ